MKIHRLTLLIVTMVLFALLFVGSTDGNATRSLREFWNLGHIALFFGISYLLLTQPSPLVARSVKAQFIVVISFTIVLGAIVEIVQARIGRDLDLVDMVRNAIGALLCMAFLSPARFSLSLLARRRLQAGACVLLIVACIPIALVVWDENRAGKSWPVLADFESSLELSRWSGTGNSRLSIDSTVSASGDRAMRVEVGTSKYAGAKFNYFPPDWTGYQSLVIHLYNPSPRPLTVTCRIHDRAHSRSAVQRHDDRFNKTYQLNPGWNQITISLQEMISAPTGRLMDIQLIDSLQIFMSSLTGFTTIYVDNVYLTGATPTNLNGD